MARDSRQTSVLPKAFDEETFAFYGKQLTGAKEQRPRWKRCVDATNSDLGEALGKVYVERTFGAEGKARTLQMVQAIEAALDDGHQGDLAGCPTTPRSRRAVKLRAVANKIGYPDRWRDYSSLRSSAATRSATRCAPTRSSYRRQLAKIGKPVDKTEWLMTPPTVNAYYNPLENNINFPAGILQPPFFDQGRGRRGELRRRSAPSSATRSPTASTTRAAQFDARRQPARLVDASRRQGVRGARHLRRESVRGYTAVAT